MNSKNFSKILSEENISEDQFEPENSYQDSCSSQKVKNPRTYKKQDPNVVGKWSQQQNIRYVMFMDYFQELFLSHQRRKLAKVFSVMAKYIPSRESDQCRSHHQKMIRKHKTSKKIVSYYKKSCENYIEQYEKFATQIKNQLDNQFQTNEELAKQSKTVSIQTQPVIVFNNPQQMLFYLRNQMPNQIYEAQLYSERNYPSYSYFK